MPNHCLAKSIHQVGWGMFGTMLKYKAEAEGKVYQEVDRFFPSSKTCHVCLNQVGSLPLDVRRWTCEHCQTSHDRDTNAAINLRDEGLRILTSPGAGIHRLLVPGEELQARKPSPHRKRGHAVTSGTGDKACRPDVSRSNRGRKKSTTALSVGQEACIHP